MIPVWIMLLVAGVTVIDDGGRHARRSRSSACRPLGVRINGIQEWLAE
ncbi:MAG: hypothetical protein M1420_02800 [Actinobacteria bacterium]|nr:hypothetical protein [Actinomycetota bacterium]